MTAITPSAAPQHDRLAKSGKNSKSKSTKSAKAVAYQYIPPPPISSPTPPVVAFRPAAKASAKSTKSAKSNSSSAKAFKSGKSAYGYQQIYTEPIITIITNSPPTTPLPTPLPTTSSPTPSPTKSSVRTIPVEQTQSTECDGDPCDVGSWCRSRYGTCGPGRLYCNEFTRWSLEQCGDGGGDATENSFVSSAMEVTVPSPTPKPTWEPYASIPMMQQQQDESANFMNNMNQLLTDRGDTSSSSSSSGGESSLEAPNQGLDTTPNVLDTLDLPLDTKSDDPSSSSSSGGSGNNFPIWALAIIGVAMALRLAVGVYAKKRRNGVTKRPEEVATREEEMCIPFEDVPRMDAEMS